MRRRCRPGQPAGMTSSPPAVIAPPTLVAEPAGPGPPGRTCTRCARGAVAPRTLVVSLVVGVGITALAALVPARGAAGVAPVEAMRDADPAEERSLRRRGLAGGVALSLGSGCSSRA
jgi:hypothetical protein